MSEKTFIEIWYEDDDLKENIFATRQVVSFKDENPGTNLFGSSWQISGSSLFVASKQEVAALRMLLDEIEKELDE